MSLDNLVAWCDLFGDMAAELSDEFSKITLSSPMRNYYQRSIHNIYPYLDGSGYIPVSIRRDINKIILEFFPEKVDEEPFSFFLNISNRNVKVGSRKKLKEELSFLEREKKLQRSPRIRQNGNPDDWPIAYQAIDLFDSSGAFLRDDIIAFFGKCISGDHMIDIRPNLPKSILITVQNDHLKKELIAKLESIITPGIPPLDVVEIIVATMPSFPRKNEMLSILSGSALLGKGSIGLIMCHEKQNGEETTKEYFATTDYHVINGHFKGQKKLSKYLEVSNIYTLKTESVDFQALRISDDIIGKCDIRNIVQFEVPNCSPSPGSSVWKFGASTGWTEGEYIGTRSRASVNGVTYERAHLIRWKFDLKFATSGDCGSIYFFRDNGTIYPFAYHVNSDDSQISYGLNLSDALDVFEGEIRFVHSTVDYLQDSLSDSK